MSAEPAAKLRACVVCGNEFAAQRSDHTHCSPRCRKAADRERKQTAPDGKRRVTVELSAAAIALHVLRGFLPASSAKTDHDLAKAIADQFEFLVEPDVADRLEALIERIAMDRYPDIAAEFDEGLPEGFSVEELPIIAGKIYPSRDV